MTQRKNYIVAAGHIPVISVFFFDHHIKVVLVDTWFCGRLQFTFFGELLYLRKYPQKKQSSHYYNTPLYGTSESCE